MRKCFLSSSTFQGPLGVKVGAGGGAGAWRVETKEAGGEWEGEPQYATRLAPKPTVVYSAK